MRCPENDLDIYFLSRMLQNRSRLFHDFHPSNRALGALLIDRVHGLQPPQWRVGQGPEAGPSDEVLHEDHHMHHVRKGIHKAAKPIEAIALLVQILGAQLEIESF